MDYRQSVPNNSQKSSAPLLLSPPTTGAFLPPTGGVFTTDATAPTTDEGVFTTDVAVPTADGGVFTIDAAVPTADVGVFTTEAAVLTTDVGVFTTDSVVPTLFSAALKPTMTIHNYIAKREITVSGFDFIVSCFDFSVSCFVRHLSSPSMSLLAVMAPMPMAVQQKKGLTPPITSIILVTFAATNPISMTTDP